MLDSWIFGDPSHIHYELYVVTKIALTDVKVLFKYNQNTRDILLLIWLSNEPRYTYL